MRHRTLIALAGAAIIASSTPLLAAAPAASAAAAPADVSFSITVQDGTCSYDVSVFEDHDSSGAFVDAFLDTDPCGVGTEGAICNHDYTLCSYGGDVHMMGKDSDTGHIPASSGNHHGIRYWLNNQWNPRFGD